VTKKSDMASRYAAAHARREQRRREAPAREFLPLADEAQPLVTAQDGARQVTGGRMHLGIGRGDAVLTSRLPPIDYSYLRGDLIRTATLAVILLGSMIILAFIIR
jgi:hypothetical protein